MASVIRRDLLCVIGVASAVLLALPAGARAQAESQTLVIAGTSTAPQVRPSTTARTLHELIQEALVNNLRVRIDLASIGEARALYELAAAQAYPRFNATALFGGPTPERKTLVQNDISTVTPASLKNAKFNFGELGFTIRLEADAVLPLYTFGKISSGKDAASSVIRAAGEKKVITQAEVMMDTFRAFWAYQLTRSFVGSLRDGEKTLQKVLKKIEEMLDADSGQVTENDRLRLLHAVATVRVKLNEAETARQIAKAALKLLIGRGQDGALDVVSADLDELPPKVPSLSEVIEASKIDRPEIRALRALIDANSKFADLRRNQLWPDIFLGGAARLAYTSNATRQTNPFIYDDYNFQEAGVALGLRYELDIFNKLAMLEQAEAATITRMAEEAAVAQAVDLEVHKIHLDLTRGYDRVQLLERANRAARGWLTASTLAYDVGAGEARELIDSFIAWAASEGELQKTRYDMHLAHADLARASGRLVPRLGESKSK